MRSEGRWREKIYDYIVVGSGAGGGPVAANLARAGYSVALLEAGGSDTPANYDVPGFFANASEDLGLRWDFFVHHYDDPKQEAVDTKVVKRDGRVLGIWYPRSGTLGGCTSHHALITIRPHDSDWENIADLTGDESWRASKMSRYFERIERCSYMRPAKFGRPHPGQHGFTGWLSTNIASPKLLTLDWKVLRIACAAVLTILEDRFWSSLSYLWQAWWKHPGRRVEFLTSVFDPNDLRHPSFAHESLYYVPFSTECGRRVGVRDLLNLTLQQSDQFDFETQNHRPNLTIYTRTLVTRVVFDEESLASPEGPRAIGVELMEGLHLYRADPRFDASNPVPPRERLRARREVILAGGAFNSPQLLMLSGIGPEAELKAVGIMPLVDRPGVGRNLQDRYEIGVVCQTRTDFAITRGATFQRPGIGEHPDPLFEEWLKGQGPYTTNGVIVCVTKKSDPERTEPDLFMFCVPSLFRGYFPGWSKNIAENKFSWLILKSHTNNKAGYISLRNSDPQQPPKISFRYFHEGSPGGEQDLDAVVFGVEFVRRINAKLTGIIDKELVPGSDVADREALRRFVINEAWGHHACGTNAMGQRSDRMAVVDSRFQVIGTRGLRVVDASVFPRIPGFFIVTPIFMIAEKASDVIIADAKSHDLASHSPSARSPLSTAH